MILYYAKVSPHGAHTKGKNRFADMYLRAGRFRVLPHDFGYIGPGSNRHMERVDTQSQAPEYPLWFASLMDSREATSPLLPVPSRLARWRPGY